MEGHQYRGRLSANHATSPQPGEMHTLRKDKPLFSQRAQFCAKGWKFGGEEGRRGATGEMPPRASAGLGGTGDFEEIHL